MALIAVTITFFVSIVCVCIADDAMSKNRWSIISIICFIACTLAFALWS